MRSKVFGVAALLAAVWFGGASAGDYPGIPLADNFVPQNTYRHYGGYDCLYTCNFGSYAPRRCHRGCRGPDRVIVIYRPNRADLAMQRDYWRNSRAFKDARDQFDKDDGRFQRQANWYTECGSHGWRHCPPPPN